MLRSVLTILIIALGIMALVGILTGIEVIKGAITSSIGALGANSFQITSDVLKKSKRGRFGISITEGKTIRYDEARAFLKRYQFPSTVGISMSATGMATARYGAQKTNPNIQVLGVDNNYFAISATALAAGRSFSEYEQQQGGHVCIIGQGVATKLLKQSWRLIVGRSISVDAEKFVVAGVAETKGGSMMMNADNTIYLPVETARAAYGGDNSYVLSVQVPSVEQKAIAGEEAEGLFRSIRRVPLGADSNFSINQDDTLVGIFLDSIKYVRWAAILVGIITVLGSVIGLMNIMLVSVAERTREIGVSKAMGAPAAVIKNQFLTESVLISLMGGLLGVVLGLLAGNILSLAFDIGFIIPWVWMLGGIALCALVGIASGIYPAIKASRLDPIEALRYE